MTSRFSVCTLIFTTAALIGGMAATPVSAARTKDGLGRTLASDCTAGEADADQDGLCDRIDPCPSETLNRCAGPVAICRDRGMSDCTAGQPLRVDIGSASGQVDCEGNAWLGDLGGGANNSGTVTEAPIVAAFGCTDAATEAIVGNDRNARELTRSYGIDDGDYVVNFLFAELFPATCVAGARTIDVDVEGVRAYGGPDPRDGLDQYAESNAQNGAADACGGLVVRSALATVTDGILDIVFTEDDPDFLDDNANVKAIEVLRIGPLPSTSTTTTTTLPPTEDPEVFVMIDGRCAIECGSTYVSDSFLIRNDSPAGRRIVRLRIELTSAILPDLVFDPLGQAGDSGGKAFTVDTDPGVGLIGHEFSGPHDGGYDVLEILFDDFDAGETFGFSVDVDPTSINGASSPGPSSAGDVSGLELVGAHLTVELDDGSMLVAQTYRTPGSPAASQNVARIGLPSTPSIEVLGVPVVPATVTEPVQTVRVSGPAGSPVALLVLEAGLFVDGAPGGGFDLDPYEANSAVAVWETAATIGAGGSVDVPVTLTKSSPEAGLNHIVAVLVDEDGATGPASQIVVLELSPASSTTSSTTSTTTTTSTSSTTSSTTTTTLPGIEIDRRSIKSVCRRSPKSRLILRKVRVDEHPNRILVATIGGEDSGAGCDLSDSEVSVEFAGLPMQRAVTIRSNADGERVCSGIFYLLDPPLGRGDLIVTWPTTADDKIVDSRQAGAFVIYGARQSAPEAVAADGAGSAVDPVVTAITTSTDGAWVVDVISQGESGSFEPLAGGQVEVWEQACKKASSASSIRESATAGQTTMSWSHSKPKRHSHALAAFAPAH